MGTPPRTIRNWINRGMAFPNEEPYGSFSRDYRMAERGLEGAAVSVVSWITQRLFKLTRIVDLGERVDASPEERVQAFIALKSIMDNPQLKELLNVLHARFPEDWGVSAHRQPDVEHSGDEWLEDHALQQEQLGALLADPPDPIRAALVARAADVYAILVAGGFSPAGKAQDETAGVERKVEESGNH